VPSRAIEDQNDDTSRSGPDRPGEVLQQLLEERFVDAVREIPDRLATGRLNKGGDVEPLIAVMAKRDRPLAGGGPDPTPNRL
jgi:hypothetical protein